MNLTEYLEGLPVTQGRSAGNLLEVLPWQRRFVRRAFRPGVQSAALSIARGNGKTTLLAGIACACLDGPLAVSRGEVLIVAASFEQARICFEHIISFMAEKLSKTAPYWRVWDSAQLARIEFLPLGSRVRCLASDPRRAHGLAPTLVLADEPAQWPDTTGEKMVAALKTAAGKQPHSRFVALGTRPAATTHWFARMLAGGCDYAQCHAAPFARTGKDGKAESISPFTLAQWRKANPSLPHMPDLERAIRAEAKAAKMDAGALAGFRALRLNQGVSDTVESNLLDAQVWQDIEGTAPAEGATLWGVDLGATAAMSAIACYWPETGRLEVLSAFPNDVDLRERGLLDGVGNLYQQGYEAGELIKSGGATVSVSSLIFEAASRFGQPSAIAADRWREGELRDALKAAHVRFCALELRGMGFKDGAEDVRAFRAAALNGKVIPLPSIILLSAMAEARVAIDPAGNAKLAKGVEGGRRLRARDDAAAAAVLALGLSARRKQTAKHQLSLSLAG